MFQLPGPLELQARKEFTYSLPEGARQGPDAWYTIRLRYRLAFARESTAGHAWVMVDTNDRTCAQVEYTLARAGRDLRYRRTTVDLEHGQREKRSSSLHDEVRYTNYLQESGVKGGENELAFRVETTAGVRVQRLVILPGTAVLRTLRTPYPLQLQPRLVEDEPGAGERFRVAVELQNRGKSPLHDVVVRVVHDPRALRRLSRRLVRYKYLSRRAHAVFSFRASRQGRHRITFVADSDRNQPIAVVEVSVGGDAEGGRTAILTLIAALAALLAGLAIPLWRKRR